MISRLFRSISDPEGARAHQIYRRNRKLIRTVLDQTARTVFAGFTTTMGERADGEGLYLQLLQSRWPAGNIEVKLFRAKSSMDGTEKYYLRVSYMKTSWDNVQNSQETEALIPIDEVDAQSLEMAIARSINKQPGLPSPLPQSMVDEYKQEIARDHLNAGYFIQKQNEAARNKR